MFAIALVATSLVSVDVAAAVPRGRGALAKPWAPTFVPPGWYVFTARSHTLATGDGAFTYYARASGDLSRGPALAVGAIDSEDGFDGLRGTSRSVTLNGQSGRLVRSGDWAWITWSSDAQDIANLVAGRAVSDDELVAAATNATIPSGNVPSISEAGLPAGVRKLVTASLYPDVGTEGVVLVDAKGRAPVILTAYPADVSLAALQRFWVDQVPRRAFTSDGSELSTRDAVMLRRGDVVVVVEGNASRDVLNRVAESTMAMGPAAWDTFRARVAKLPLSALGVGSGKDAIVLDGYTDGARWAVSYQDGAAETVVHTADSTSRGSGSSEGFAPLVPRGQILSIGSVATRGPQSSSGTLAAGAVPITTSVVELRVPGRDVVRAKVSKRGPDETQRYFAMWIPDFQGTFPVVAYDAKGNEVARREQFGCNVCP